MRSFYLEVYGCQMNVADARLVARILGEAGWNETSSPEGADAILLLTCSVRDHAVQRIVGRSTDLSRHRTGRPGTVIGLLGCAAQHLRDEDFPARGTVDLLAGPDSYRRLPALLEASIAARLSPAPRRGGQRPLTMDLCRDRKETYEDLDPSPGDGVSAFLTVQRGCDRFCAYCVVPLTRGRERCTSPGAVVAQVQRLVAGGCREVTLLGQSVSSYRHGDVSFAGLLRLVGRIPGLLRLRFTSPHPACFDDDLVQAIAEVDAVCPHVHLPVQSGSDRILAAMGRGHTVADYLRLVERLRRAVPGIALTTDLMVGFPGETEEDFARTLDLCQQVAFDTSFMFAYSPRKGTRAFRTLADDVPEPEKARRLNELIALQEAISLKVLSAEVGRVVEVLVAGRTRRGGDRCVGRTDTFRTTVFPGEAPPGSLVRVRVEAATAHTLVGRMAGDPL